MGNGKNLVRGLLACGQKVRTIRHQALPTSSAGANCSATLANGNRITGWAGSELYDNLLLLRAGDNVDFMFTGVLPQSYTAVNTGVNVSYLEFQGVELIPEEVDVHLEGVKAGSAGVVPSALAGREPLPMSAPKSSAIQGMTQDVPLEQNPAGSAGSVGQAAEC
jgi:hypothetical protein